MYERIRAIEHNRKGAYLFCSKECKNLSEYFNVRNRKCKLTKQEKINRLKYLSKVNRYTNLSIRKYKHLIPNIKMRGTKFNFDLDHQYSICDGFENNISPKIIGHFKNIRIINSSENRSKHKKSSIKIEDLLEEISIFENWIEFLKPKSITCNCKINGQLEE